MCKQVCWILKVYEPRQEKEKKNSEAEKQSGKWTKRNGFVHQKEEKQKRRSWKNSVKRQRWNTKESS